VGSLCGIAVGNRCVGPFWSPSRGRPEPIALPIPRKVRPAATRALRRPRKVARKWVKYRFDYNHTTFNSVFATLKHTAPRPLLRYQSFWTRMALLPTPLCITGSLILPYFCGHTVKGIAAPAGRLVCP